MVGLFYFSVVTVAVGSLLKGYVNELNATTRFSSEDKAALSKNT